MLGRTGKFTTGYMKGLEAVANSADSLCQKNPGIVTTLFPSKTAGKTGNQIFKRCVLAVIGPKRLAKILSAPKSPESGSNILAFPGNRKSKSHANSTAPCDVGLEN